MGHPRIAHRDPPVRPGGEVHGDMVTYGRDLRKNDPNAMEASLADWVGGFVSRSRVLGLMQDARPSLDACLEFMRYTTPMSFDARDNATFRIYLHLLYGMTSSGAWWVRAIGFGMEASQTAIAYARKEKLRDTLEQRARDRQDRAPIPAWKIYFDPKDGSGDFQLDVKLGKTQVQALIDRAHALAKQLQPTMKNPIGWDGETTRSLALETTKAVLGPVAGMAKEGSALASLATGADAYGKAIDNSVAQDGFKLAGDGMDFVGAVATGNPLTSLGSLILGSFLSIAIANDTARVAKARAILYTFFVGGVIHKLTRERFDTPKEATRKEMYGEGLVAVSEMQPRARYQLQVALLHYAATRNTTNSWSLQDVDQGWIFPDDYQRNWSPSILARSLVWQMNRLEYLTR